MSRRKASKTRRTASKTRRPRRVTTSALRRFVVAESKRLDEQGLSGKLEPTEKVKAEEVEADGYAGTLEKDIDHAKALKIQERRLTKKLKKIREARTKLNKKIVKRLR